MSTIVLNCSQAFAPNYTYHFQDLPAEDPRFAVYNELPVIGPVLATVEFWLPIEIGATLLVWQRDIICERSVGQRSACYGDHWVANLPVRIWVDYPFEKPFVVHIYPLIRRFLATSKFPAVERNVTDVVYYAWQICLAYQAIYKDHAFLLGPCATTLGMLHLEAIQFHQHNQLSLVIAS